MTKKNLSKIIFASLFASGSALAQTIPDELLQSPNAPVVTVGGFVNFDTVETSQSRAYSQDRLPDAVLNANGQVINGPTTGGTANPYSNKNDLTNDSEIYVKVGAISDSGLKYGAVVELEADTTINGGNSSLNAEKSFIFTESHAGKFEFGNNLAANQKMKVGPAVFARAAGGINGKYLEHVNAPMLANSTQNNGAATVCNGGVGVDSNGAVGAGTCSQVKLPRFILIPQSPVAHGGYAQGFYNGNGAQNSDGVYNFNNSAQHGGLSNNNFSNSSNTGLAIKNGSFGQMEDATKISYYTPRVNGWQLGSSFTPNTGDSGASVVISSNNSGNIKNVISWGLNYVDSIGNLGFAVSATGEHGEFQNAKSPTADPADPNNYQVVRNRLNAYDTGFMFTYFGFTIGASYGYWGTSLQANKGIYSCNYNAAQPLTAQTCSAANAGKKFAAANYYTTGLAYEFGPIAFSLTTMSSNFQQNKYQAQSFGVDYKITRGIMPYIEITKFKFTANQPQASNIAGASNQILNNQGYVGLLGILLFF